VTPLPINTDDSPSFVLELIYRLKVKDVMTRHVFTASPGDPLRAVQELMKERGITGVPVSDHGRLVGIVSVDDIIRALDAGRIDEPAEKVMTRKVIVLEDDMPLSFGISYFDRYRYGRFPVLNKDKDLVGIISSRDIITALLVETNREMERIEASGRGPESADHGTLSREYAIQQYDFEHGGRASNETKRLLRDRGIDPKVIRRAAIAAFELEMNVVVHSVGGRVLVRVDDERIEVDAIDRGPGIPDLERALQPGWSTANDWIKSLGFGAGMGLPNIKRVSDEFTIESDPRGTRAHSVVYVRPPQQRAGGGEA
jgi:CBS domain-containing protein/anti-sigma regulatory factor (Ser/Thr protein kinase)